MLIIGTNLDPGVGLGLGFDFHLYVFGKWILDSEPPVLVKSSLACCSIPLIYPANALCMNLLINMEHMATLMQYHNIIIAVSEWCWSYEKFTFSKIIQFFIYIAWWLV
jgi:hypothetical protein